MKLTQIETIHLTEHPNFEFVRLQTDEGLVGYGETTYAPRAIRAFIHETAAPLLLGKDPLQIDLHWRTLYERAAHWGGNGVEIRALSALDIALWDIFGQAANMPIYQLLGGACRDRIPTYNTCGGPAYGRRRAGEIQTLNAGALEDLEAFMNRADELAEELLAEGIRGMKIWPFDPYAPATRGQRISFEDLEAGIEPIRKIRRAVGNRMEVMIEGHGKWTLPAAKRIAHALEEYEPFWLEDLIRPVDVGSLVELKKATRTPILASEMLITRFDYQPVLDARAADIVMVDPAWCGGISESRKIAHMAETYNLPVTFHDCVGPINLFAGLHLAMNAPNAIYQESVRAYIRTFYNDLVTTNVVVQDGNILAPQGAGLGTQLLPELFKRPDAIVELSSVSATHAIR